MKHNTDIASAIIGAVEGVTKGWTKQRKAEERDYSRRLNRQAALTRMRRVTIKEAACQVMAEAYLKASSGGTLPAAARQIMYAARGQIQDLAGRPLDDKYFTQTLLPDYMAENPAETASWDVIYDARGNFVEPHTELTVPLGTVDVRDYLEGVAGHVVRAPSIRIDEERYPTKGPQHRFSGILFCEKEGFLPLFKAVHLAERFDITIMSTKGLSVTAARHLVEQLCSRYGVPLLVLRDFDKSGFSIVGTLRRDTRRYEFTRDFNVIDLGLRLEDVEEWELESEEVLYSKKQGDPRPNLFENGATEEEAAFLVADGDPADGYHGERVELNAFASADLIAFIETKLRENNITKVIPDEDTLTAAYRRAAEAVLLKQRTTALAQAIHAKAEQIRVPKELARKVKRALKQQPTLSWDDALLQMAEERFVKTEGL
jgi:hypothetical protein